LNAISCAGASLCVAVDGGGGAISATNLNGGPTVWNRAVIDPGSSVNAVSCPSTQLCVAVGDHGDAIVGTGP
jgi:hypothetical protein